MRIAADYFSTTDVSPIAGVDRNEFLTIYRTLLNMQKQQSKALIVLFYKVNSSIMTMFDMFFNRVPFPTAQRVQLKLMGSLVASSAILKLTLFVES